ncbi:MAG: hypothetical protein U9R02_16270 [Thermodesulfobacteriota bacterium]|nr:hypothetical protein [Thermodesulfobacteriota bacterium]
MPGNTAFFIGPVVMPDISGGSLSSAIASCNLAGIIPAYFFSSVCPDWSSTIILMS